MARLSGKENATMTSYPVLWTFKLGRRGSLIMEKVERSRKVNTTYGPQNPICDCKNLSGFGLLKIGSLENG